MVTIHRFDICLVELDPTRGSEIQKTRPCVILSPDEMNDSRLRTVIAAPMTSTIWPQHPTRVDTVFQKKSGQIALDQLRAIDRDRIQKILGHLPKQTAEKVLSILQAMFSE